MDFYDPFIILETDGNHLLLFNKVRHKLYIHISSVTLVCKSMELKLRSVARDKPGFTMSMTYTVVNFCVLLQ